MVKNLRLRILYLLASALRVPIGVTDDYWLPLLRENATATNSGRPPASQ